MKKGEYITPTIAAAAALQNARKNRGGGMTASETSVMRQAMHEALQYANCTSHLSVLARNAVVEEALSRFALKLRLQERREHAQKVESLARDILKSQRGGGS